MPSCIPSFLQAHWVAITSVGGYVVLTMVRHLPQPGVKMTAYEYFYGVLQSLLATPVVRSFEAKVVPVTPPPVK
jgi:hypothetical protein